MTLPLEGLLVVSIEQAVAAPMCTCRLADAGARVIKIERPEGDFAQSETSAIVSAGGLPITLGPLVLRAVTDTVLPQNDFGLMLVLGAGMFALMGFQLLANLVRAHRQHQQGRSPADAGRRRGHDC